MLTQFIKIAFAALLAAPGAVQAGAAEDICRVRAERQSGYAPGRLVLEKGKARISVSGSAGFGVSVASSGAGPVANSPQAGAAALERQEKARAAEYQRLYSDCTNAR